METVSKAPEHLVLRPWEVLVEIARIGGPNEVDRPYLRERAHCRLFASNPRPPKERLGKCQRRNLQVICVTALPPQKPLDLSFPSCHLGP